MEVSKIKKNFALVSLFAICLLISCSGEDAPSTENSTDISNPAEQNALIFNTASSHSILSSDRVVDFITELTNEQLNAVFPGINLPLIADALYYDGMLVEVAAVEHERFTRIRLAKDNLVQTVITVPEGPPEVSYIYGVAVTAFMIGDRYNTFFQADFVLDGITYHITFLDSIENGPSRMTELVKQIILNGPADLSALANPTILDDFSHELSLSEAHSDPDFGLFVPSNIPESFISTSITRNRHSNQHALRLEMEAKSYSFGSMTWHISHATAHDISRIVSVGEWEAPDLLFPSQEADDFFNTTVIGWTWDIISFPVFLVEELTQGVFWVCVYRLNGNVEIGIIIDDIIINIFAYGVPMAPVWDMIVELITQFSIAI